VGAIGSVVSTVSATLKTFAHTAGSVHTQFVRSANVGVTPANPTSWTVTTAGSASVVAADVNRVVLFITSYSNSRVYVRFDVTSPTIPTAAVNSTFIDPDERMVIGADWACCAVSLAGVSANGFISLTLGTDP
jgi:hypothetical protein